MKTAHVIILFSSVLATSCRLFAGNGSIYSSFGVGDIITYYGNRSAAMGGTGVASLDDSYINEANPAGLGQLSRTQYSGDFQYQGYGLNDGTGSSFLSSGNFQAAGIAFPVDSDYSIAFSFSITPFSRRGYDVIDHDINAGFTQSYSGTGGLSSAQFGFSFSLVQDVYFGVSTHYLFGNFDDEQKLAYDSIGYFSTDADKNIAMHGFAFTVGAVFAGIDKAIGISKEKNMNIGATLFSGTTLASTEQTFQNFSTSQETTNVSTGSTKIPLGFALGLEYDIHNKMIFTGDAQFQQWNQFTYMGVHPAEIQNSMRFGVGAEFLPTRSLSEPYYHQVTYRAGGYINESYLKINGETINEYFITGGIGVPIFFTSGSEARVNIGLEYGIRGSTSNGLEHDSITRLTISINGSDSWFNPPEVE
ncbi:MAG: hypothetical protein WBZ48_01440 [Bacteroidota bacterium]